MTSPLQVLSTKLIVCSSQLASTFVHNTLAYRDGQRHTLRLRQLKLVNLFTGSGTVLTATAFFNENH